jgi:hypothetical protein
VADPRLKIVVDKGPSAGREFVLVDGTFVLGRDPRTDIPLLGDDFVSGHHARVIASADGAVLHNLSPNGTFINGRPVLELELTPGDRISIGSQHLLSIRSYVPPPPPPPPTVKTRATAETATRKITPSAGTTGTTAKKPDGFRMPIWLIAYLGLMAMAFVVFGVRQLRDPGPPTIADIQAQEQQYATARKLDNADTDRVLSLLATGAVHERRGDRGSAYEAYREVLGVRRPIDPFSPGYRYAASRIAALGAR